MSLPADRTPRKRALRALNAYAEAVTQTLLPALDEAFAHASDEEIDARLASLDLSDEADRRGNGFGDPNARADRIMLRVEEDRTFVSDEITRLAIAGAYHIWERSVAEALLLKGYAGRIDNFEAIKRGLTAVGYDLGTSPALETAIDRLRLLTNAIKHGPGPSMSRLAERHADFVEGGTLCLRRLAQDDFAEAARTVRSFWLAWPPSQPDPWAEGRAADGWSLPAPEPYQEDPNADF